LGCRFDIDYRFDRDYSFEQGLCLRAISSLSRRQGDL
jgi:hypothetical protein